MSDVNFIFLSVGFIIGFIIGGLIQFLRGYGL